MHFVKSGQGKPILFLHGWTMNGAVESHDFEPTFQHSTDYERIYVDLPGMGNSPHDGIQSLDDILNRLKHFVEEHILPRRFLLVGTSCGAYLARALACTYENHIDGLLLRVPLVEPESTKRDLDAAKPAFSTAEGERTVAAMSTEDLERYGDFPVHTEEYITQYKQKLERSVLLAVAQADHAVLDLIRNDPSRYVLTQPMHGSKIPFLKPTLIITGRQDTDVGYRDALKLLNGYPRATFVALDRAGHGLPVDEQALFKALVEDWLRRTGEESKQP